MLWRRVVALVCVAAMLISGVAPAYGPGVRSGCGGGGTEGRGLSVGDGGILTIVLLFDRADGSSPGPQQLQPTPGVPWVEALRLPGWVSAGPCRHESMTSTAWRSRLHRYCRLTV